MYNYWSSLHVWKSSLQKKLRVSGLYQGKELLYEKPIDDGREKIYSSEANLWS